MLINKKDKIIIFFVIISIIIFTMTLIFNIFRVLKYREGYPKDILYISSVSDKNDYQVVLKPNNFIDNTDIDSELSYISSLVEYIDTNFYYEYKGEDKVPVNYDYFIKANIISEYIDDVSKPTLKPLWNKEFILVDHKKGQSVDHKITINENLKIGIDYYNNLINTFKTDLNLSVNSVLEIKLIIRINGKLKKNQNLIKEHYMLMSIPLDVKAFDITTSKNFVQKETVYSKVQPKVETSYMLAIIYLILIILVIYIGSYVIKKIRNNKKSKYALERNKILKHYDDRIVTVSNFINYDKLEIVDIPNFDELLNLSNEAYEPIICWERKEKGILETWFSVIRNKVLYRYVISKKIIKNKRV